MSEDLKMLLCPWTAEGAGFIEWLVAIWFWLMGAAVAGTGYMLLFHTPWGHP